MTFPVLAENKKASGKPEAVRKRVTGFEPATSCLASTRSSQLSYTRIWSEKMYHSQKRSQRRVGAVHYFGEMYSHDRLTVLCPLSSYFYLSIFAPCLLPHPLPFGSVLHV